MEVLIKLLIVHFLGDVVLQTDQLIKKKEKHLLGSDHLYWNLLLLGRYQILYYRGNKREQSSF
ncbi:DUF3307 domain-containing protein [Nonlabens sp.]|uniref:DUF3307 domain-containing protein n=1 Tax=Nonlabens sp. TaxID=1888209 RepID=UPI001BCFA350|nr:DUF3307 domain-containing protein [Nonlabens sp.]